MNDQTNVELTADQKSEAHFIEATSKLTLLGKDVIKSNQDMIRVSLTKLDAWIHANAVQCLMHAEKHGDTSLFRRLLVDIVDKDSGYRRQGLIAWMRRFSPMELHGDVIKLTGTINGEPIPFDVEAANLTPFRKVDEFAEKLAWKPVFKGSLVQTIERALKKYKASVENTQILDGKVVGPIDPSKEYYSGINLDKMDTIFDELSATAAKFETFSDDTAEVEAARKAKAEAESYLSSKEKEVEAQVEQPAQQDA